MIIISSNVVLNDDSKGINGDNPIFGYHNLVTATSVSATTNASNHNADNLANPNTVVDWRATGIAVNYITVDTQSYLDEIDYVAVVKHNFGSAQIALSVECATGVTSGAPSGWVSVSGSYLLADDAPVLIRFAPRLATGVRLRLDVGSAVPRAAVMYAGKLLVGQRRIYVGHTPITDGRVNRFVNGQSESANFLGRIKLGQLHQTSIELNNLTPAWVRTYLRPFVRFTEEAPFFFAWRPLTYPNEVGYVWHTDDVKISNARSNGMMQASMNVAGIVT